MLTRFADELGDNPIVHTKYEQASRALHTHCSLSPRGRLILFVGPTGVGKSTIMDRLGKALVGTKDTWPTGHRPWLSISAANAPD